jgi:hypothetical protein
MTTKRLNKAELARVLGVNRSSVTKAVRAGRVTPGLDGLFDPEQAMHEWRAKTRLHVKRGEDEGYEYWRQQKVFYKSLLARLEYQRMAGELLPMPDVDYLLMDVTTSFRAAMEGLADRLAPLIAPCTDPDEVRRIVQHEVQRVIDDTERAAAQALDELARGTV